MWSVLLRVPPNFIELLSRNDFKRDALVQFISLRNTQLGNAQYTLHTFPRYPRNRGRFLKKNSGNAEFERRRREDRGAEGAEGVGRGENFSILDLKQVNFGAN